MQITKIVRPGAGLEQTETIMTIDGGVVVTVTGAGAAGYTVRIDGEIAPGTREELISSGLLYENGEFAPNTFGAAAVWYEDFTLAHAVRDLLANL